MLRSGSVLRFVVSIEFELVNYESGLALSIAYMSGLESAMSL